MVVTCKPPVAVIEKSHLASTGKRQRALLYACLTAILWGTAYVAAKYALRALGPFTAATGRFVLGAGLLWPLLALPATRRPGDSPGQVTRRIDRRDRFLVVAIGLFQVTFYFALQYVGMRYTTAANTALIVNTRPVFVALLSAVWLHEGLGRRKLAGILMAFLGVVILTLGQGGTAFGFSAGRALGDLLILLNAVSGAIAIILLKRMLGHYTPLLTAAYTTTAGALGLSVLAIIEMARGTAAVAWPGGSLSSWLAVIFMAVFNTVIPYLLWYSALSELSTTETTVFLYITPLVSVLLSAVLLDEPLGIGLLIGGALILAGAYRTVSTGQAKPANLGQL
jgi:drug/metabolite transporter (DMT)-like permease